MSTSNTILTSQNPAPKRAIQISGLFALVTGLTVPMYGFIAWQLQAWQLWAVAGTNFILMAGGVVGFWLARRGQNVAALRLLIGVLIFGALLSVTFVGGIGILGAILVVMLGLSIASQGIPRQQLNRSIVIIIVAAFGVASVSFITEPLQFIAPGLDIFINVASVLIVVVFGVFVARSFLTYPIATKLLLAFIMVAVVSSVVVAAIADRIIRDQLTQAVGQSVKALADSNAVKVATLLNINIDILRGLSLNKFIQDAVVAANQAPAPSAQELATLDERWHQNASANNDDPLITRLLNNEVSIELRELQRAFPQMSEIFVTDRNGLLVGATASTSDYFQADEEWWQAAVTNSLYIGQPALDESSQSFGLIIAVEVLGHDGQTPVGVVRGTMALNDLAEVLSAAQFGETGDIDVHLPNGFALNSEVTADGKAEIKMTEDEVDLQTITQSAETYQRVIIEAEPNLTSFALVRASFEDDSYDLQGFRDLNWIVVAHQSEAEALQDVGRIAGLATLGTLGTLVLTTVLAVFVTQLLVRPITHLTETATKITGGDLNAQAPIETDDEVGALATAFNVMTTQLRETLAGLETRVAERTRAIATSAEVSRRLSTVLDRQKLVSEVVEQVQDAFGYYYVQIYFWDEAREHLVMAGGTGEPGQTLLARGHKLLAGRGLVGRAAETNTTVLVPHTAENPAWLPNPLLPDTRAEVAVPIALGDRVLGVLDIQHNVVNGLDNEDVEVLQSLANQVAVATQNARTFAQTQRQADVEALVNTIGQKIQSATTVESALQVAAREVGRALGGTKAVVRLKTSPLTDHASR